MVAQSYQTRCSEVTITHSVAKQHTHSLAEGPLDPVKVLGWEYLLGKQMVGHDTERGTMATRKVLVRNMYLS